MFKTRLFQHGRINYSIKYKQFQMKIMDEVTGEKTNQLCHEERVKYYEFPFKFGETVQWGPCEDPGEYYRQ